MFSNLNKKTRQAQMGKRLHVRDSRFIREIVVLSLFGLFLQLGCGPGQSSKPKAGTSVAASSSAFETSASETQDVGSQPGSSNRCALLTDGEVQEAIGPHHPGINDVTNEWGFQSCRWTSTIAQKSEAYPDGWFDAVEIAVFDKDRESWARGEARGKKESGVLDGALYDKSYGELWFNCGLNRFCVVKMHLASDKKREPMAIQLAKLVDGRLR